MVSETLPLAGARVVDLTRFVAGSFATMCLAAMGAEVLKIEVPPDGDPYRRQGAGMVGPHAAIYLALNNGKRSVALDFRSEAGRRALDQLVKSADFFVENSRPGMLRRSGLDYQSLHEKYPALIYGSISGYGQVGPDASRGGFDLMVQAESGIVSVTGSPGSGLTKMGPPVLDVGAGVSCVAGLLAAFIHRQQTGQGMWVSSSLYEFAFSSLATLTADYLATGDMPTPLGSHSPTFAPYGIFRTADGAIAISGAGSEQLWLALCDALDREDLIGDARFVTNATRVRHRDALTAEIETTLVGGTTNEWRDRLEAKRIPVGCVRDLGEVVGSEQVAALGLLQRVQTGKEQHQAVAAPFRFGSDPMQYERGAPDLGADTTEVLRSVGYSSEEIGELAAEGVVIVAEGETSA